MCATIYGGMAANRFPQSIIDAAKVLWLKGEGEVSGIAAQLLVPASTIRSWAMKHGWGPFGDLPRADAPLNPTLESVLVLFEQKAKQSKESAYNEKLADFAYAVPFFLCQLNVREVIDKADKVARLVELSRKILGKDEPKSGRSAFSVNFLAGGAMPPRIKQVELIEEQALAPAGS